MLHWYCHSNISQSRPVYKIVYCSGTLKLNSGKSFKPFTSKRMRVFFVLSLNDRDFVCVYIYYTHIKIAILYV